MDQNNYFQLNKEIQKLKEGDYTSYQNFYGMTSNYLYQILMGDVQNQDIANELINELYTDIYASIGTELTDNSQFFEWAANKAQNLSTTYLATHNINEASADSDRDKRAEEIAIATAVNSGLDATTIGVENTTGIGIATAGETGQAGMSTAVGVGGNNAGAGMVSGVAKTGMSFGAKLAIGIIGAAAIIGAGIGVFKLLDSGSKEKKASTEITSDQGIIHEGEQEDTSEENEMTSEAATEEEAESGDTVARYTAYYGVVKDYMEQYPAAIDYAIDGGWTHSEIKGFSSAQLIDFDGDGSEQLVLSHFDGKDAGTCGIDVYDYQNETAELIASYTANEVLTMPNYGSLVSFDTEKLNDGTYVLSISEESGLKSYAYEAGAMKEVPYDSTSASVQTTHTNYMYYYSVNALSRADEIREIEDSLILKHKTITEIAEKAGDDTFINTISEPGFVFDAGSGATTQVNKYNETYNIDFYGNENAQLSANGKTISYDVSTEGTVYVSYMDDMLVIPYTTVGSFDTSVSEYIISEYWWRLPLEECNLEKTNRYSMNKYEEITEDEFNTRINALLND